MQNILQKTREWEASFLYTMLAGWFLPKENLRSVLCPLIILSC